MVCQLLVEDPDLAEAIPRDLQARATQECIAPVERLTRGRWTGEQPDLPRDAIGLLVLEGLLIRRVGVDGRFGAELLGVGDLLRPWQGEDAEPTLPHTAGWRVLQTCRVAILDNRVAARLSRYPQLTARLVGRALERSRNLAVQMAIIHQPRIHIRLHMLLWHLADRWGRVGTDGISLALPLSHTMLADLVAARRPTVTVALAELEKRELVRRVDTGLVLIGEPPGELLELRSLAVPHAAGSSGIRRAAG